MTPDWFHDLAQRCAEAADYAEATGEPAMANDLHLAQHIAEVLAYLIDRELAEDFLLPLEDGPVIAVPGGIETAGRAAGAEERSTGDA